MKIIGHIHTDFSQKFGIPRQSGLVPELEGTITFLPPYRNPDAFKGLEGFNYIWLLWEFDIPKREGYCASVKPPRLGGNTPMGVFATRSPYRPNPVGLSSVRLERIEYTQEGPVLYVRGADLRDGTAIYDIKPYLGYADCHTDAVDGFAGEYKDYRLEVSFPENLLCEIPAEKREALIMVLAEDPRPSYQDDPDRRYGVNFAGFDVRFKVCDKKLQVVEVVRL